MKLRCIQKASSLDLVTLTNVVSSLDQHKLKHAANETLIGVPEIVQVLTTVYKNIEVPADYTMISNEFCVDLTLNWLLNVYDSGRVGKIRVLSFKIGLVTMARAHLEDKYKCKLIVLFSCLFVIVSWSKKACLLKLTCSHAFSRL